MPKVLNFKVIIEQDENGVFVASIPAIPGCHTQGQSYEEALGSIKEALELCLEEAKENKAYRMQIAWPEEMEESRFLGVMNIPVSTPSFL